MTSNVYVKRAACSFYIVSPSTRECRNVQRHSSLRSHPYDEARLTDGSVRHSAPIFPTTAQRLPLHVSPLRAPSIRLASRSPARPTPPAATFSHSAIACLCTTLSLSRILRPRRETERDRFGHGAKG